MFEAVLKKVIAEAGEDVRDDVGKEGQEMRED